MGILILIIIVMSLYTSHIRHKRYVKLKALWDEQHKEQLNGLYIDYIKTGR